MTALNRKLLRDLWQMKGQAIAICLVIIAGVATFVMALSTLVSLQQTQITYYDRYRFADVFAHVKRAPNTLAGRIAEIPGVARVQTRIVVEVNLDVPRMAEPATGRLVSIPTRRAAGLNDIHLRLGRYIEPGRKGEVLINEKFAEVHSLEPGDSVRAVMNGRLETLRIVGVALSPEYVLQIQRGDSLPDDKHFGVFWMGYDELAAAFDLDGAFNSVALKLRRGASEQEVIQRLDALTEPYGGVGAYGRRDQVSHRYLSDEIKGLRGMGMVAPIIFLGVAAFLLNVVMNRLISTQREQVAALKAFGYSKREIGAHYLKLVLIITLIGVAVGTGVGGWLGRGLTRLYTMFYRFPLFAFRFDTAVVGSAVLISIAAAVIGTIGSVRRAVNLPPAEAMRPEPPTTYRPTVVERLGLQRLFAQTARMVMRHLERRPFKSLLSSLGIAMAVAVLVMGNFMRDSVNYLIDFQFYQSQRQDVMVTFNEPTSAGVLHEVSHLPGVIRSEPFRGVSVRLRLGHRHRRVGIMGLPPDMQLYRVIDKDGRTLTLPNTGVVLSDKLAELLGAGVGDTLTAEVLEGQRPVRPLVVAGIIKEYAGTNAYMQMSAVQTLLREGNAVSGAFLAVDSKHMNELYAALKNTPRVAGVSVKAATIASFNETIASNQLKMQSIMVIFACVIAFGVVYNTARISLSERSRELATLRVIGLTRGEISAILLGELAVLTLVALPIGMLIGYGLAATVMAVFESELYRFPLVVNPATFAFAAAVTLVASLISGLIVRRKLDHLDLVAVLKSKE